MIQLQEIDQKNSFQAQMYQCLICKGNQVKRGHSIPLLNNWNKINKLIGLIIKQK